MSREVFVCTESGILQQYDFQKPIFFQFSKSFINVEPFTISNIANQLLFLNMTRHEYRLHEISPF